MKKVIKGKLYNTKTSTEIAGMTNGRNYTDFTYYEASIYQTKKGNLFLYEHGGAMSKMAIDLGNNSTGGSADIRAIDQQEAYEIAATWHEAGEIDAEEMLTACRELGVAEPLEA